MKKLIALLALVVLHVALFAQAPQGINYQAVAYNNLGQAITNQTVGVRLSVLDGGAAGPFLYSETQTPNTDNTGLFSIVIGNGTPVSGTFASINWGNGTKWLKTEIDIAGGNNYVVMGSSQFMSVPYALYADKSSFKSGSFNIPDGFERGNTVLIPQNTPYTVPAGKNLYISSSIVTAGNLLIINGDTVTSFQGFNSNYSTGFLGFSPNSNIKNVNGQTIGYLVDKKVEWKTINLSNSILTVPANQQFALINFCSYHAMNPCSLVINSNPLNNYAIFTNIILESGSTMGSSNCTAHPNTSLLINGYFID